MLFYRLEYAHSCDEKLTELRLKGPSPPLPGLGAPYDPNHPSLLSVVRQKETKFEIECTTLDFFTILAPPECLEESVIVSTHKERDWETDIFQHCFRGGAKALRSKVEASNPNRCRAFSLLF